MKCLINERHLTPKTTFAPISIISTDPHTRRPFHDPIYSTLWAYHYTVHSPLQTYTKKLPRNLLPIFLNLASTHSISSSILKTLPRNLLPILLNIASTARRHSLKESK